jgi:hypothetical protein
MHAADKQTMQVLGGWLAWPHQPRLAAFGRTEDEAIHALDRLLTIFESCIARHQQQVSGADSAAISTQPVP